MQWTEMQSQAGELLFTSSRRTRWNSIQRMYDWYRALSGYHPNPENQDGLKRPSFSLKEQQPLKFYPPVSNMIQLWTSHVPKQSQENSWIKVSQFQRVWDLTKSPNIKKQWWTVFFGCPGLALVAWEVLSNQLMHLLWILLSRYLSSYLYVVLVTAIITCSSSFSTY